MSEDASERSPPVSRILQLVLDFVDLLALDILITLLLLLPHYCIVDSLIRSLLTLRAYNSLFRNLYPVLTQVGAPSVYTCWVLFCYCVTHLLLQHAL